MMKVFNFLDHFGVMVPIANMIVFIYIVSWIAS